MAQPSTDNYFIGSGILYFREIDETDSTSDLGELDLGNCVDFSLDLEVDQAEHVNKRSGIGVVDKRVPTKLSGTGTIVLDEITQENLALALYGTKSTLAQAAGTHTENVVAKLGRWMKMTYRSISNVVIAGYTEGVDFEVDEDTGRVYITPAAQGGNITADEALVVQYAHAVVSLPTVQMLGENKILGFLRFIGDPPSGPILEVEVWKASLVPTGSISFISDDWTTLTLNLTMENDETNHPDEPYCRIIVRGFVGASTTSSTTS